MLNNRELATLILIVAGILACVIIPRARRAAAVFLPGVLRALLKWQVLLVIGLLLAWVTGWIALGSWVGLWDVRLLKDSVVIVLLVGTPALFHTLSAKSGSHIFANLRRETVSLSAFVIAYVNLEPFPLVVELLLQPLAVFTQLISVAAERGPARRIVRQLASAALVSLGIGTFIWATIRVIHNAPTYDARLLALALGMGIWLPLSMFPFLYGTALLAALEKNLNRLVCFKNPPLRVRLAVILGMRFSLARAARFNGRYKSVADAKNYREAARKMREFHADLQRRDEEERQRIESLTTNAGVQGVDEDGAQLDRREFYETKKLLERIATSQGLRYECNGRTFWDDRTDMTVADKKYVRPEPHGFIVETTPDKQTWRAWRRLPSGWVLGIGGAAPGDEYVYQAPQPPVTWPPDKTEWTNAATSEWPSDWHRFDGTKP